MSDEASSPTWYTIKAAAEYLQVGEPTIYRWMRDGRMTFRKVGDSTRFLQEDLDAMVQVVHSKQDAQKVKSVCPVCHSDELTHGKLQSTGLVYFRPNQTKFWSLQDANIKVDAAMCGNCGYVAHFGDVDKLNALKESNTSKDAEESENE